MNYNTDAFYVGNHGARIVFDVICANYCFYY